MNVRNTCKKCSKPIGAGPQGAHDPCVLEIIIDYKVENDGNSPSLREIVNRAGFSSTSVATMSAVLGRLKESGFIRLRPGTKAIVVNGGKWTPPPGKANEHQG